MRKQQRSKTVKFITIAQRLEEFEGKTAQEIAEMLGYKDKDCCRSAFYNLKKHKKITFRIEQGQYRGLTLLDDTILKRITEGENMTELNRFKTWQAVTSLYRLQQLTESETLKPKEELEAIKEQGRIRRELTSSKAVEYAKQIEEQLGITNPWQEKKA